MSYNLGAVHLLRYGKKPPPPYYKFCMGEKFLCLSCYKTLDPLPPKSVSYLVNGPLLITIDYSTISIEVETKGKTLILYRVSHVFSVDLNQLVWHLNKLFVTIVLTISTIWYQLVFTTDKRMYKSIKFSCWQFSAVSAVIVSLEIATESYSIVEWNIFCVNCITLYPAKNKK